MHVERARRCLGRVAVVVGNKTITSNLSTRTTTIFNAFFQAKINSYFPQLQFSFSIIIFHLIFHGYLIDFTLTFLSWLGIFYTL